jgi:tetratricopeptide (TPR) repeat protein
MKSKKELNKHNRSQKKIVPAKTNKNIYYGLFAIAILTFLLYSAGFKNGFVWDDDDYIKNNPLIHSINLKDIFSNFVMGNYHPLTILVYAIEFKAFGLSETGYHVINALIHVLNTIFVFYLVNLLCGRPAVALIASLLFGIHPLHVESVTWASELKDLLYSLFFIVTLIYYLKFKQENKKKFYYYALIFFLLSLLSKAMAASLPVALILIDYFKGYKIDSKSIMEKIPFFILAVILGFVAIQAQKTSGATDIAVFPLAQRIVFASYGFVMYLVKLILPTSLSAYYAYPIRSGGELPGFYYAFVLIAIGIAGYALYSLRKSKIIFMSLGFFAITVFLVLQLLPVGGAIMADRYSYIPSIGIFYLIGEGIFWLFNNRKYKTFAYIITGVALIFYSVQTTARITTWKNGMTLWNDVIDQYQTIPQAYINRGIIFAADKKYDEALKDYNKAMQIEPRFSKAYNNRGALMRLLKKYDQAISDFSKAIELQPDYAIAYNNRGLLMNITKQYDNAVADYSKAISLKKDYAEAFSNRGIAYRNANKFSESYNDFNQALFLNPNYYKAYSERGLLMMAQNKFDDALSDFNKTIQMQPEYANAYFNRGNLYMTTKKNDEAISDFSKAISLQPALADAYYYRGICEAGVGRKNDACKDLQTASSYGLQYATDEYKRVCQ